MHAGELWSDLAIELPRVLASYRSRLSSLESFEKADHTLLTEADLEVEALIIDRIRGFDPTAGIIGEESGHVGQRLDRGHSPSDRVWVIDPIDGTAEFVRHDRTEFCSVVCLLEHGVPSQALVVAAELGANRGPLVLTASSSERSILVNGEPARSSPDLPPAHAASVTRSAGGDARHFEATMTAAGYTLKTRTTSQTLDMVRTAVSLAAVVEGSPRFDLFFRRQQKLWDGVAGICFGECAGLTQADLKGATLVPVSAAILDQDEPTFETAVMGRPEAVAWFLEIAQA